MNTKEHLEAIISFCRHNLEIAEKRTPGKWAYYASRVCSIDEFHDEARVDNVDVCHEIDWRANEPKQKTVDNLQFIAACAGAAEAGWKATIAAIEGIQQTKKSGDAITRIRWGHDGDCGADGRACDVVAFSDDAIAAILAAYPEDMIKP